MTRRWPDYATVWRWHFYAGLLCVPFVCWLALTGSIYLFRPEIEALIDRPLENMKYAGIRAQPSAEVAAAINAVPGSEFSRYETPATATGAAQIVVEHGQRLIRVAVHPRTLQPLRIQRDDHRLMEQIFNLHGNLLMGNTGSVIVELAASWAIVMIVTGLCLWFPRGRRDLGGIVYPRLQSKGRVFWRDLHAVTGMWISLITLFVLFSGLPWAKSWGSYFNWARSLSTATAGAPDWPIGIKSGAPSPQRGIEHVSGGPGDSKTDDSMPGMTAVEMAAMPGRATANKHAPGVAYDIRGLDGIMPTVAKLKVPRPVWILPPGPDSGDWLVSSQAQNRPIRIKYRISGATGEVTSTSRFSDQNIVDRVVNVAVATHEGQLFGPPNQALLLLNATGLVMLSASSMVMWWRRRPDGVLGAPKRNTLPQFRYWLATLIVLMALLLPLFGTSLVLVLLVERLILRRIAGTCRWLGLDQLLT